MKISAPQQIENKSELIRKIIFNKYIRFAFYTLDQIGIKESKSFIYMINLENKTFLKEKTPISHLVSIRRCTKKDADGLPKKLGKTRFLKNLEEGHIMIGAFIEKDIVGYIWLSFQKVYVPEIKAWIEFDGGYLWDLYVTPKFRKKGIGKTLVKHALKTTHAIVETKKAYALVNAYNIPSQKMFESMGFKKSCTFQKNMFHTTDSYSKKTWKKTTSNITSNSTHLIHQPKKDG